MFVACVEHLVAGKRVLDFGKVASLPAGRTSVTSRVGSRDGIIYHGEMIVEVGDMLGMKCAQGVDC
jgi:hypothetical protein